MRRVSIIYSSYVGSSPVRIGTIMVMLLVVGVGKYCWRLKCLGIDDNFFTAVWMVRVGKVYTFRFIYNICFKNIGFSCIKITVQHGRYPVKLLNLFRTHSPKNTSGGLLMLSLVVECSKTLFFI